MGSRLGRRVVHFANLPIKLLMPTPPFDRIREIALKTIPSASKIEIRRVLESLYGFDVEEVRTLNRDGKKKKRGGFLAAAPDYKKAYVTLRSPLSLNPDLFPVRMIQEEKERIAARSSKSAIVEAGGGDGVKSHWLDDPDRGLDGRMKRQHARPREGRPPAVGRGNRNKKEVEVAKFPWSSMRSWSRRPRDEEEGSLE